MGRYLASRAGAVSRRDDRAFLFLEVLDPGGLAVGDGGGDAAAARNPVRDIGPGDPAAIDGGPRNLPRDIRQRLVQVATTQARICRSIDRRSRDRRRAATDQQQDDQPIGRTGRELHFRTLAPPQRPRRARRVETYGYFGGECGHARRIPFRGAPRRRLRCGDQNELSALGKSSRRQDRVQSCGGPV